MQQPYKNGTPLTAIIRDGWSRGFDTSQIVAEALFMGHSTTVAEVNATKQSLEIVMTQDMKQHTVQETATDLDFESDN